MHSYTTFIASAKVPAYLFINTVLAIYIPLILFSVPEMPSMITIDSTVSAKVLIVDSPQWPAILGNYYARVVT